MIWLVVGLVVGILLGSWAEKKEAAKNSSPQDSQLRAAIRKHRRDVFVACKADRELWAELGDDEA